jgi:predicted nucleic acid-binding protein
MDITVDTSVIMAVVLNEPTKSSLIQATEAADLLSAPSLVWEVGNALLALFRRRRLNWVQADVALESFRQIPIRYPAIDLDAAVKLAEGHSIYAYDAYILECARRYGTPLLSLDGLQCDVARALGIPVLELK